MKRTQRKDALRNIRKQFISFMSILIVITLGVGIFLACHFGTRAMADSGNDFYNKYAYHDIEVRSTRGITPEDVNAVKALDGISEAEGVLSVEMVAAGNASKANVQVISHTNVLDQVILLDGELPKTDKECVIEEGLASYLGVAVGDTAEIYTKGINETQYLKGRTFKVVGLMMHPSHIHLGESETCNIMVTADAFDTEAITADYTGILIRTDTEELDTFSEEYTGRINDILLSLSAVGKERSKIRDDELLDKSETLLKENEEKLEKGKAQLDQGKSELEEKEGEIAEASAKLEAASSQLESGKTQLVSSEAELNDAKVRLDSAKKSLDEAAAELEEGRVELDAGAAELASSEAQLNSAKAQLDQAYNALEENRQKLAAAHDQLIAGRSKLDLGEAELENKVSQVNAALEDIWDDDLGPRPVFRSFREASWNYTLSLDDIFANFLSENGVSDEVIAELKNKLAEDALWVEMSSEYDQIRNGEQEYASGIAQYEEGMAQWNEGKAQYDSGLDQYQRGLAEYTSGLSTFRAKEAEYNSGKALYESNLALYNSNLAQYEEGLKKYEESKKKIEDGENELSEKKNEFDEGRQKLSEGENELAEKTKEYEEGVEKLDDARKKIDAYEAGHWIFMDRTVNLSWHELKESCRSIANIGNGFALLFVLLGILVTYATIGKIIDEQMKLVGTTKALGFFNKEIFAKYLLFGGQASLFGCLAGLALAYFVLQQMVLSNVDVNFRIGTMDKCFELIPGILTVVIGVAVSCLATWIACRRLLLKPATVLMNGEIPVGITKEKKSADRKKKKSLYIRLVFRNISTDLKRVAITVGSIAGCCMLLVIGFTLKDSFSTVIDRQYEEIISYDYDINYLPKRSVTIEDDIREKLFENGAEFTTMYKFGTIIRVGQEREMAMIVSEDPDALMRFYHLTDTRKNSVMRIPDAGAVIFNRLAEVYHLEVGDHISILDQSGVYHDVLIAGIYNNYAGRTIFMSDDYAREIFGGDWKDNAFMASLDSEHIDKVIKEIKDQDGYVNYTYSSEEKGKYQKVAKALDVVIAVMLLMAGIMSFMVILNLIFIQINQKKRELTIMRVNGFTTKETVMYILRENIITTILGTGIGLVVGHFASVYNLSTVERVELMMRRDPSISSYVYSALITFGFAAVMNVLALRKIKKLKLTDVND